MRALWSDRQNCSHNVSQKVKRIRRVSENRKKYQEKASRHRIFRDQKSMGMVMFKRTFARTIPHNLRAPQMKTWGFEAKRARKFTRTSPRTLPWNFITMLSAPQKYDRAKVPPYNGNDPPPAPPLVV